MTKLEFTGRSDLLGTWWELRRDWYMAYRQYDAAGMWAATKRMGRIARTLREGE